MELLKSAIFILTITKIYHSEGFSAGLNSNFDICGLQCGFGINGVIPNACQFLKPSQVTSCGNSGCSSKLSQLSEKVCSFLKKKEHFLKQLFSSFQSQDLCQSPLFSVNLTPSIEKIKLPNTQTGSSCICFPGNPQVRISPHEDCSENCDKCNQMV